MRPLRGLTGLYCPSLALVDKEFKKFYDLLSCRSVEQLTFRAHFQEAEGLPIRNVTFEKCLRLCVAKIS